jgi:hypothetical protein
VLELKTSIKLDLVTLIDEYNNLTTEITTLSAYFSDVSNVTTLNNYTTEWVKDKPTNIALITQFKDDIDKTEKEIKDIFDNKLGNAKEEENKAIKEYIDIIINNVKSVIDNPNIITSTGSSSHSTGGPGRGSPAVRGSPGGPGRGRGRGAAPKV